MVVLLVRLATEVATSPRDVSHMNHMKHMRPITICKVGCVDVMAIHFIQVQRKTGQDVKTNIEFAFCDVNILF